MPNDNPSLEKLQAELVRLRDRLRFLMRLAVIAVVALASGVTWTALRPTVRAKHLVADDLTVSSIDAERATMQLVEVRDKAQSPSVTVAPASIQANGAHVQVTGGDLMFFAKSGEALGHMDGQRFALGSLEGGRIDEEVIKEHPSVRLWSVRSSGMAEIEVQGGRPSLSLSTTQGAHLDAIVDESGAWLKVDGAEHDVRTATEGFSEGALHAANDGVVTLALSDLAPHAPHPGEVLLMAGDEKEPAYIGLSRGPGDVFFHKP